MYQTKVQWAGHSPFLSVCKWEAILRRWDPSQLMELGLRTFTTLTGDSPASPGVDLEICKRGGCQKP